MMFDTEENNQSPRWEGFDTQSLVRYRDDTGAFVGRQNSPLFSNIAQRRANDGSRIPSVNASLPHNVQQDDSPASHTKHAPAELDARYYESATIDTCDGTHASEIAQIRLWMSARPRIASLRDLILALRTSIRRETQQQRQRDETFKKLGREIIAALNESLTRKHDTNRQAELNRLSQELEDCRVTLNIIGDRIISLEDHLSSNEYHLQQIEADVYRKLEQETERSVAPHAMQIQPNTPQNQSFGLLETLYSRMGDVRIFFERLNNFEYDLRDELDEREVLHATGGVRLLSDAQFFEQSRRHRENMERDLEFAQEEVEKLKKQCVQAGIEFEEPRSLALLSQAAAHLDPTTSGGLSDGHDNCEGKLDTIGAFITSQERIEEWLEKPFNGSEPGQGAVKAGFEQQPRRESGFSDFAWIQKPDTVIQSTLSEPVEQGTAKAQEGPQWTFGPQPGSSLLEALLLESASTPLGRYAQWRGNGVPSKLVTSVSECRVHQTAEWPSQSACHSS